MVCHCILVPVECSILTRKYCRSIRHIDAALYDLDPPKVTTLYGLKVPQGETQTVRYDDGTGDELKVPLGTTSCKYSSCVIRRAKADSNV